VNGVIGHHLCDATLHVNTGTM